MLYGSCPITIQSQTIAPRSPRRRNAHGEPAMQTQMQAQPPLTWRFCGTNSRHYHDRTSQCAERTQARLWPAIRWRATNPRLPFHPAPDAAAQTQAHRTSHRRKLLNELTPFACPAARTTKRTATPVTYGNTCPIPPGGIATIDVNGAVGFQGPLGAAFTADASTYGSFTAYCNGTTGGGLAVNEDISEPAL